MATTFTLFGDRSLQDYLALRIKSLNTDIEGISGFETDEQLVSIANEVVSRHRVSSLDIQFDSRESDIIMVDLPGFRFPAGYDVQRNKRYPKAYIQYKYRVLGNDGLLNVTPQGYRFTKSVGAEFVRVNSGTTGFTIGYQTLYSSPDLSDQVRDEVKRTMKPIIEEMPRVQDAINAEIKEYNDGLLNYVTEKLKARLATNKKRQALKDDLNDL